MDELSTDQMIAEVQAEAAPEPSAQETAPAASQESAQPEPSMYEYTANGKTVQEPLDVILKRASQGYNYAQHMSEYKKKAEEVDSRYNSAVELEKKYGEIDKFAQENPEWNDHLHKSWESRFDISGQNTEAPQQQAAMPAQLQQEFNAMKEFVEGIKAERADAAYSGAVSKVKDAYPDIDFSSTDPETGTTLEQQVLNFAEQNNIGKFEPAFKAYYHDQLVERARTQAKDQMAENLKQRSKAGLLGTSQTPNGSSDDDDFPSNFSNLSMDEVHNWVVGKYT